MSVRNMGRLLGLKKVESYWLVHKNYFETVVIAGKMRVVISSPRSEAEIRQLVADTERGCPIYNLVTNAQKISGRIERVKAKNK